MPTTSQSVEETRARLASVGQEHLLRFVDELSEPQRAGLLAQIDALPLDELPRLIDTYVRAAAEPEPIGDVTPPSYYPYDAGERGHIWDRDAYTKRGEDLIRAGKIATFTVAGGQGSRLGHDGPKGTYKLGAITGKPLFQFFAEIVKASSDRYDVAIPWYIMTSPLNHEDTIAFFEANGFWGLPRGDVMFFPQGVMPSLDAQTGRILLTDKHMVATNPDGHGGSLRALIERGAIDDMKRRGVEHFCYHQVDNAHCMTIDPAFIGLHAAAPDSSAEISSKMLPKAEPKEKVGLFTKEHARIKVIEYSDLPDEIAEQTEPDGTLRFRCGSIAIHQFSVAFVEKLWNDPGFELPYHRAIKKVPHVDLETGQRVEPENANAVKLERFVFDALPRAERSIIYETDRVLEFAPVKNATGVDSAESARLLQTERSARWLEAAGVTVPRKPDGAPDCVIEISPLTALDAGQLAQRDDLPGSIEPGAELSL